MKNGKLYVATIASDAAKVSLKYNLGLEIDEFCTASNMDEKNFYDYDKKVKKNIKISSSNIFHAPFNELFPAAIDPLAVDLAYKRFNMSYNLTKAYGINRMVVHSGFVPYLYFKEWFLEKSVCFWREFMSDKPNDFYIMIENVLEDDPYTLAKLAEDLGDHRIGICLDLGHAACMSKLDLIQWIKVLKPYLTHVHLHNNDMTYDYHWPLGKGKIDMRKILDELQNNCSEELTYTIENSQCEESVKWLLNNSCLPIE